MYFLSMSAPALYLSSGILPWDQINFRGAIVIVDLITAIPFISEDIGYWVWAGF